MSSGRILARLTVTPALLVVAWLVIALPLLTMGMFDLGPALVLFVPAAYIAIKLGFRDRTRREIDAGLNGPVPWWTVVGVVLVAVAFLVLQLAMCAEQVIVRRDAATYVQFAAWLNDHGSLPVSPLLWAFGGGDPSLAFDSPGFYQDGDTIVPQFMAGWPLLLALGGWVGGTPAMLAMAPLLGACAVLSFGGLTARLAGPRWAPAGALLLALTLPMQWASRSTYSELPALVLLLGGLSLLHDVRELESRAARMRAFIAGLTLGLTVLVRIDALRDLLPVVLFAGLLAARGRPTGVPLAGGLAVGAGAGLLAGLRFSRPYLNHLDDSLRPLLFLVAGTVVLTVLGVLAWRRRPARLRDPRLGARIAGGPLPAVAAIGTVLLMIGFALRPHLQTVVRRPGGPEDEVNVAFIESVQRATGLVEDGTRQYSELSLYWVVWYVGVPALLIATFGAALLARRLPQGRTAEWLLPFTVIAWTTVTTLWRPGITPDHPWASRRLLSLVIPGLLLLALWGLAWAVRRVRRFGYGPWAANAAAGTGVLLIAVPTVLTSAGLMFVAVEQGELSAVRRMCERIGPGHSVLIVERVTADRFSQVVRSMCGLPTARLRPGADAADVRRVAGAIESAGRRPAYLGAEPADVAPYGRPEQVLRLRTRQDERTLVSPPDGTWGLSIDVWMVR